MILDDVQVDDAARGSRRASSTWVRELLAEGRVREAAALLGRLPSIRSTVVHGEQRGRELGYPTANLDPDIEGFLPARRRVRDLGRSSTGSATARPSRSATTRRSTGVPQHQVETHLFDQQLDLYDKPIELEFVDYLRPMNKFDSVDALVAQLHRDDDRIRRDPRRGAADAGAHAEPTTPAAPSVRE